VKEQEGLVEVFS